MMPVDPPKGWWSGGFPEVDYATTMQKKYLTRRMHVVRDFLSKEESVLFTLVGGFEEWISSLTKDRATAIIARIKSKESSQRLEVASVSLVASLADQDCTVCPDCGHFLVMEGILRLCKRCSYIDASVRVSLEGSK
jgi:tRNA(Ile2) C34 agmatinyltransferase TiaS